MAQVIELLKNHVLLLDIKDDTGNSVSLGKELWLILDKSGSMEGTIERLSKKFYKFFVMLGYKRVKIITFNTYAKLLDENIDIYKTHHIGGTGGTNISPAMQIFDSMLNETINTNICLLVISDGEVQDLETALNFVKHIKPNNEKGQYIRVGCWRIKTSYYGRPDTRALSCFMSLHNDVDTTFKLLDSGRSDPEMDLILREFTRYFSQDFSTKKVSVYYPEKVLRYTPFNEVTNTLQLTIGKHTILLTKNITKIIIGGMEVSVVPGKLENELQFRKFLINIESKIRTYKVLGNKEDMIIRAMEFIDELGLCLKNIDSEDNKIRGIKKRIGRLKRDLNRQQKSIIRRIQEIANESKVSQMNSLQQAEFLRKIINNKSGRRLAKRSKVSNMSELEVKNKYALEFLRKHIVNCKNSDLMSCSYISLENGYETIKSCIDEGIDDLPLTDKLQCLGFPGISFVARIGQFVEPWIFRVEEVFNGCYLGQQDLWNGILSKSNALQPPGILNKQITGVDPMVCPWNPNVYKLYCVNFYNQMHASAVMRRVISPISGDILAVKTAVIMRMVQNMDPNNIKSIEIKDLLYQLMSLRCITKRWKCFDTLKEHIEKPNFEVYLSGEFGVSNVSLVLCFLMGEECVEKMNLDYKKIGHALCSLSCYHYIRRQKDIGRDWDKRLDAVYKLLGIDIKKNKTKLSPLFEEEGEKNHYDDYVIQPLNNWKNYIPYDMSVLLTILKIMSVTKVSNIISQYSKIEPKEEYHVLDEYKVILSKLLFQPHQEFLELDCSYDEFLYGNIIQSLMSTNINSRIDKEKREMKTVVFNNKKKIDEYLRSIVRAEFNKDYQKRLSKKKVQEKSILLNRKISEILIEKDIKKFIKKMNEHFPNSDSPGYDKMVNKIIGLKKVTKPLVKLWILVTGSYFEGKSKWNNGNLVGKNVVKLGKFVEKYHHGNYTMKKFIEISMVRRFHRYRVSNIPNRHGYSNNEPSWWALGYEIKNDYLVDNNSYNIVELYHLIATE